MALQKKHFTTVGKYKSHSQRTASSGVCFLRMNSKAPAMVQTSMIAKLFVHDLVDHVN